MGQQACNEESHWMSFLQGGPGSLYCIDWVWYHAGSLDLHTNRCGGIACSALSYRWLHWRFGIRVGFFFVTGCNFGDQTHYRVTWKEQLLGWSKKKIIKAITITGPRISQSRSGKKRKIIIMITIIKTIIMVVSAPILSD